MDNPGLYIKNQKQRGEWAEMRFLARVSELGLTVIRPWGDSLHYDMVVESDGCLLRVQVKSSTCKRNNSYFVNLHGSSHYYTKADFDFIAAYIIALDLWYIIPAEAALRGRDKLCMTPGSPKARYEPYREAWHLLKEKPCATNANAVDLCFRHGCRERMAQDTTPSSPTPTELSSRPASRP